MDNVGRLPPPLPCKTCSGLQYLRAAIDALQLFSQSQARLQYLRHAEWEHAILLPSLSDTITTTSKHTSQKFH